MDNSCLNMAHFYGRKADKHLRYRRYDDAIACHQKAAELLDEAIQKATVPKTIESLQLQRNEHLKYKELAGMKKDHFDKYTHALEQQKRKTVDAMDQMTKDRIESSCQLQFAIYKTMEDTDSLLEVLCHKTKTNATASSSLSASSSNGENNSCHNSRSSGDNHSNKLTDTVNNDRMTGNKSDDTTTNGKGGGAKKSNEDTVVIEELRTLNHQLHILVFQLVSQLDEVNQDSESLRERVKQLERTSTRIGGPTSTGILPLMRQVNIYDEPTTTFIDSGNVEIGGGGGGDGKPTASNAALMQQQIPCDLPPLELPTFDYTSLDCKK